MSIDFAIESRIKSTYVCLLDQGCHVPSESQGKQYFLQVRELSGNIEKMSGNFEHLTNVTEMSGNFVMTIIYFSNYDLPSFACILFKF